ncbi:transposase [Streptomyces turgidiscabies]|uniref:transposase n=1 Tax=Streptomyces turgidiscabies TaxID=85558 RepID=UPI00358F9382
MKWHAFRTPWSFTKKPFSWHFSRTGSFTQTARELDVNPETLRSWVRRYGSEHGKQAGPLPIDERAGSRNRTGASVNWRWRTPP